MLKSESISVIIPVYNAEDFVGEAIESVLKQTVKPLEVILVNDGSTDASVEEIKTYIPDVKLINQENKGIGGARNTGIKNAKGELFSFLDSDDLWTEDHLEILLSAIQQDENISIVSGYVEQFLNEKNEELSNRIPKGQEVMAGYVAGASLIKKEVFDKVGLFDDTLTLAEYIDWFARAKDANYKFKLIDDIVLRRRVHGSNIGVQKRDKLHDYTKVLMASIKRKRESEKNK